MGPARGAAAGGLVQRVDQRGVGQQWARRLGTAVHPGRCGRVRVGGQRSGGPGALASLAGVRGSGAGLDRARGDHGIDRPGSPRARAGARAGADQPSGVVAGPGSAVLAGSRRTVGGRGAGDAVTGRVAGGRRGLAAVRGAGEDPRCVESGRCRGRRGGGGGVGTDGAAVVSRAAAPRHAGALVGHQSRQRCRAAARVERVGGARTRAARLWQRPRRLPRSTRCCSCQQRWWWSWWWPSLVRVATSHRRASTRCGGSACPWCWGPSWPPWPGARGCCRPLLASPRPDSNRRRCSTPSTGSSACSSRRCGSALGTAPAPPCTWSGRERCFRDIPGWANFRPRALKAHGQRAALGSPLRQANVTC
jgi:hypothetical protein